MKISKYYLQSNNQLFYTVIPKGDIIIKDEEGIIMYKIPYTSKHDYYPVYIAEYALGNFNKYVETKSDECKKNFLKQVDWLVKNIVDKGDFGIWEHHYTLPYYNFDRIPWVHGMAQGLAISALLRAYQLTNDEAYLETAKKAYGAFERNIEEGGVQFIDEQGNIWLEEYAILPPPHILNGFIFALLGVYDLYQVTNNERALNLFKEGIKTLEINLPKYDLSYWSLYNLIHEHPAPMRYHSIHIKQLAILHSITGINVFQHYAEKWEKCLNTIINKMRANLERNLVHLKVHGIRKGIKVYIKRRKWMRKNE